MDDKGGFDEDLRRALRELNQNAGECPSADVLEAYTRGGLPTSGAAAIQNHLHGCGICELVVQRLQTREAPDWKATEKKLRKGLGIAGETKPAWRRILWNPAPAYALAAVLAISLGVAHRTTALTPSAKPAPQALIGVPTVLVLEPETRGGRPVTPPRGQMHSDTNTIVLKFSVPIQEGSKYWATILNGSGSVVVPKQGIASQDTLGNFYVTCDPRTFGAGDYVLRVTESGGEDRPFEFPFSVP
jgi:hypothetical protein